MPQILRINEIARFENPGETTGWTGEGEITPDTLDAVNRWHSTHVARDYGKALTGLVDVYVTVRLRGLFPNETLLAVHPGGTERISGITQGRPALYRFELRSTLSGEFSVSLSFATGQKMMIESISVLAPAS